MQLGLIGVAHRQRSRVLGANSPHVCRLPGPVLHDHEHPKPYTGGMSAVRQVQVTFDYENPRKVAEFWKAALGYVDPPVPPGHESWNIFFDSLPEADQESWGACQDPDGNGPRLYFQRVPEPKTVKNRIHLDVRVGTGLHGEERLTAIEAEAARL